MHAVLRSVQAIAANHRFNAGIVSCGNHTENVLGWASFHDIGSIGVHQPLGDMTKLELYKFAEYINLKFGKEIIPTNLYDGAVKPAAELPDAMEDPINYIAQSGICADLIRQRKSGGEILQDFVDRTLNPDYYDISIYDLSEDEMKKEIGFAIKQMVRSVYKNAQSAPIVMISPRSRGFSSRETLINKYTY
jgi:NAD+ synthase (glutamine-hydrolysing)